MSKKTEQNIIAEAVINYVEEGISKDFDHIEQLVKRHSEDMDFHNKMLTNPDAKKHHLFKGEDHHKKGREHHSKAIATLKSYMELRQNVHKKD